MRSSGTTGLTIAGAQSLRRIYAKGGIRYPVFIRRSPECAPCSRHGAIAVDFVYLLFVFVLAGATLGFLLLCDRLGSRT